jgi:hypothetical protein
MFVQYFVYKHARAIQGKEELAASLRLLQQLPSELHESQHDTAPVFTAFRDLFTTLNR